MMKVLKILLVSTFIIGTTNSFVYAQRKNPFKDIENARIMGDFENIKGRLSNRNNRFKNLTDEQRMELNHLRELGDHDGVQIKLEEFGIGLDRFKNLTDEQRMELRTLRESGDQDALFDKLREFEKQGNNDLVSTDGMYGRSGVKHGFENKETYQSNSFDNEDGLNHRSFFRRIGDFFLNLFRN